MVTKEDIIPNTVCAAAGWYKNEKCDGEEDPYSQDKRIGPLQGLCGYGNICYARNTILQRINKGGPIHLENFDLRIKGQRSRWESRAGGAYYFKMFIKL